MDIGKSHSQRSVRRGSAAVALVVTLGLLSLVVVGVVMTGARDTNVGTDRMDGLRAEMAAEAGLQMAIREVSLGSDEDKDGSAGTIGSGAPLPLGGASVQVSMASKGSTVTLTSTGTRGNAVRTLQATMAVGSSGGVPTLLWSSTSANTVIPAEYSGSGWTTGTSSGSLSKDASWITAAASPTTNESMVVTLSSNSKLDLVVRSGGVWGSVVGICNNTGSDSTRLFGAAYEQQSGNGLVCYWRKTAGGSIGYRTVIGGVVSSESTLSNPGSHDVCYISLVSRPGSNQILMLSIDSGSDLYATLWDGASFGTPTLLDASVSWSSRQCAAGAFESGTGRAMVVWGHSGSNNLNYSLFDSKSWSAPATMAALDDVPHWVRLAADPSSNAILLGVTVGSKRPWANNWTGSAWGTPTAMGGGGNNGVGDGIGVAFEGTGGSGLVAYRRDDGDQLYYRTWSGSSWGSEVALFKPNSGPDFFMVVPTPGAHTISIAVKSDKRLDVARWDGTSMGSVESIDTSLTTGNSSQNVVDLVVSPGTGSTVSVSSVGRVW